MDKDINNGIIDINTQGTQFKYLLPRHIKIQELLRPSKDY